MGAPTLVHTLVDLADEMEREYDEDQGELTIEQKCIVLAAIRNARADLSAFEHRVEAEIIAAGPRRMTVTNLGEVEVRRRTKRTQWDHDGLTRKLVALALDERKIIDETTGEYEPAYEAVARVLSECARPSWRVTPLRARHVPIDEYCTEEADGYTVQLPGRAT